MRRPSSSARRLMSVGAAASAVVAVDRKSLTNLANLTSICWFPPAAVSLAPVSLEGRDEKHPEAFTSTVHGARLLCLQFRDEAPF